MCSIYVVIFLLVVFLCQLYKNELELHVFIVWSGFACLKGYREGREGGSGNRLSK